ncbi:MAG: response regulator [Blastocatellia bacterium]
MTAMALSPLILIVEDEEDNRLPLRLLLEHDGFRVVEAADGLEAVDRTLREKPDLVLMDISLPGLDGLSAVRRIRELAPDMPVPIIIMSAYDRQQLWGQIQAAGANAYLPKPLDLRELGQLIRSFLPTAP